MERIGNLHSLLTTATNSTEANGKQNTELKSVMGDKTGGINPPQIIEEIERLKIIRKKYQSLEDTERCMTEWKAKGNLDLHQLESFVLGEIAQYGLKYIDFMKNDPDYSLTDLEGKKDDQRRLTNMLLFKIMKQFPVSMKDFKTKPWDLTSLFLLTGMTQRAVSTKLAVHFFLYGKSLLTLGTDRHLKYLEDALALRDLGCFALTELTHGSNVQGCITNAVFDEKRKNFVLYTPHERGIKFWIGNAAQTANMAVIAANLIVKGKDYGIHLFVVEIRDRVNHNLVPGVTLGDCGEKMGLNGVDNGFLAFRGLRVPREALLNKITDVDEFGTVTSKFDNKNKRFAVQLSALSDGRVKVGTMGCMVNIKCCCIALRFSTIRRQFGKDPYKEMPIIEYPSLRNRVFPLLAQAIVPIFASRKINNMWYENWQKVLDPKNKEMKELHGLISVIKPLTTTWTLETMSEVRQVMGGLGYSWYAEIPKMIADAHIMTTWEGDNTVLLQQVSKFIMKSYKKQMSGMGTSYNSLKYLGEEGIEDEKFEFNSPQDFRCPHLLLKLMKIRAKKAAIESAIFLASEMAKGLDPFNAWNRAIPFELDSAAKFFGELYIYEIAMQHILQCPEDRNKNFLTQLLIIFAVTRIKASFEYISQNISREHTKMMNELLLDIFEAIKYDAVLCFDGLMMEDEIVRSPFGSKTGNMYEQFLSKILTERDNFGKAPHWKEIVKARNGMKFDL